MNITKLFTSFILVILSTLVINVTFAQDKKDSSTNGNEFVNKLLDYSRPGMYHQLLGNLVGTWSWEAKQFEGNTNPDSNKIIRSPSGTLVRKPFANGRFFIVELTSGKGQTLQSPIQDGKMQEDNFKTIEIEGYDNVKQRYEKSFINNHVGSMIVSYEGNYDSTKKLIVYETSIKAMPGVELKIDVFFRFIDNDHYKTEDYMETDGKLVKNGEAFFTRMK